MKQDSKGTYHDHEYKIELKKKLSPNQREDVEIAIKKSPLFHRCYERDGNIWFELRSSSNQDIHKEPDASILIESDYLYIMRETKDVWKDLSDLKDFLKGDLEKISIYTS